MSQKLAVYGFESVGKISQFNEDSIKNYNEDSDIGYFLKFQVKYPKQLQTIQWFTNFKVKNEN